MYLLMHSSFSIFSFVLPQQQAASSQQMGKSQNLIVGFSLPSQPAG